MNTNVQTGVNEYIEALLEEAKYTFQPGLETFGVHASKIRQAVIESVERYSTSYANGYKAVIREFERLHPESDLPRLNNGNEDPLAFLSALRDGTLYELLGFSHEAISSFYEAAVSLYEQAKFEEARDAFFFLTQIMPQMHEFWLALAHAYISCNDFDSGLEAAHYVIRLQPHLPEGYLAAIRGHLQLHDYDKIEALCNEGLALAYKYPDLPWATHLSACLEEARRVKNQTSHSA